MSSIRDKIAQAQDLGDGQVVSVPEWDVKILIVSPTVWERSELLQRFPQSDDESIDFAKLFTSVLIACCHDPETGERVFSADDEEMLLSKNGAVAQPLFEACQRAAGFNAPQAVEEGKDGS